MVKNKPVKLGLCDSLCKLLLNCIIRSKYKTHFEVGPGTGRLVWPSWLFLGPVDWSCLDKTCPTLILRDIESIRAVLFSTFGIEITAGWANARHIWTKAADVHIWTCYGLFRDNQFAVNSCDLGIAENFKSNPVIPLFRSPFKAARMVLRARKWVETGREFHIRPDTNAIPGWLLCLKIQTKKPPEMRSGHLQMSFQLWQISEKMDELSARIWRLPNPTEGNMEVVV